MKKRDKNLLSDLNFWLEDVTTEKFKRGVQEHGGSLDQKPVMDLMREEIIDLPTYFFVLEKQRDAVVDLLTEVLVELSATDPIYGLVEQAINIVISGNPEGEELDD